MNRAQQERIADLGKALQEAITGIIDMNDGMEDVCENVPTNNEEYLVSSTVERTEADLAPDLAPGLAPYEVIIKHVNNGFIVNVGCQTFAFESIDKLSGYMKEYFNDPQGTANKHFHGELFK